MGTPFNWWTGIFFLSKCVKISVLIFAPCLHTVIQCNGQLSNLKQTCDTRLIFKFFIFLRIIPCQLTTWVHPTSWIFFVFSGQVDTYEKRKIWKFEVATPFSFCGRAIWNLGESQVKSVSQNERPLVWGHFFKTTPPRTMKISILSYCCCRLQNCHNQSHNLLPKQSLRALKKWDKYDLDSILRDQLSKQK